MAIRYEYTEPVPSERPIKAVTVDGPAGGTICFTLCNTVPGRVYVRTHFGNPMSHAERGCEVTMTLDELEQAVKDARRLVRR